ncbi:MAG: hypothetical protein L0216_01290 [Planctomycetales bacterium]|nr:hypothetical protein [Planctomycetales bacterium]
MRAPPASSAERRLGALLIVLAALGPVGGLAALGLGTVGLWGAPGGSGPFSGAGILLGPWATCLGLGLLGAAPFRLAAGIALVRGARWAWPATAVASAAGLADLGPGVAVGVLASAVWRLRNQPVPIHPQLS